jgi:hypothetical protein
MIDRDEAVRLASVRAKDRGWEFSEEVSIVHRRGWFGRHDKYEIETNPTLRGTKARFVIDAENGEILEEGYIPW